MVESEKQDGACVRWRRMARTRIRKRAGPRSLCFCDRRPSELPLARLRKSRINKKALTRGFGPARFVEWILLIIGCILRQDSRRVYEFQPLTDPRWGEFLVRHPSSSIFHTV